MNTKKFNTQKEAVEYYGHTWKYIEKHALSRFPLLHIAGIPWYFINK